MEPAIKRRDVSHVRSQSEKPEAAAREAGGHRRRTCSRPGKRRQRSSRASPSGRRYFIPPVPEPLKLSSSAVENYRKCPQQYAFSYLWSLKEGPRATLSFGSVMHTTIKRFLEQLKKGGASLRRGPAHLRNRMEQRRLRGRIPGSGIQEGRAGAAEGVPRGDRWPKPPKSSSRKKPFELPLENDVILAGRMDQVNSLGRNDVEIVDYKTGKPKKEAEIRKSLQLSIYALAAKEIFEWNPMRLVFHYLQDNSTVVTTRDAKQIADAEKIIQETAADIRAKHFPAKPGFACRSCAYA